MSRVLALRPTRPLLASLVAGGIGCGLVYRSMFGTASAQGNEPTKVFTATNKPNFVRLPLESSEDVNHNVKKLRFKLPQDDAVIGIPAVSAILTVPFPKGRWFPAPKPYTPISPLDEPGVVEFMIKKYPNGRTSGHMHAMKPGDTLLFALALNGYQWKPNSFPHVTLIAGGLGITPIFQLTQAILRNPDDRTNISLVFAARQDRDLVLKDQLDELARRFPGRLDVTYVLSDQSDPSAHRKGYVTKELLQEVVPATSQAAAAATKVFVSGPPAMEQALVKGCRARPSILAQLGYRKDQIHQF